MLNPLYWRIPPHERKLTEDGIDAYIDGKIPLRELAELWCWLHNLLTPEDTRERLALEAEAFLAEH